MGYELKKVLRRPFTIVVMIGCLVIILFVAIYGGTQSFYIGWGPELYGSYEAIPKAELQQAQQDFGYTGNGYDGVIVKFGRAARQLDREAALPLEGVWDDARLQQMVEEYQAFMNDPELYTDELDSFSMEMRRWSFLEQGMSEAEIDAYDAANPIRVMKPEYRYGRQWQKWSAVSALLDAHAIAPDGTARSFAEAFPLVDGQAPYRYCQGPASTANLQGTLIGILIALLVLAGVSPLFCDELTCNTEPMLLSAKYGRDKLITAKLAAGFLFAFGAGLLLSLVNIVVCGLVYGFEGYLVPLQFNYHTYGIPFAFNFLGYLLAQMGYQLLGALSLAAVLMLLSSVMRSAFPVVFTGGVFALVVAIFSVQGGFPLDLIAQAFPPGLIIPDAVLYSGTGAGLGILPLPQWAVPLIACGAICVVAPIVIARHYRVKR